jgi:hypothetical protein
MGIWAKEMESKSQNSDFCLLSKVSLFIYLVVFIIFFPLLSILTPIIVLHHLNNYILSTEPNTMRDAQCSVKLIKIRVMPLVNYEMLRSSLNFPESYISHMWKEETINMMKMVIVMIPKSTLHISIHTHICIHIYIYIRIYICMTT